MGAGLLIGSLHLAIRLWIIGDQGLYDEEAFTWQNVTSFPSVILGSLFDVHPPLYYLATSLWTRVFGYEVTGLRLPSTLYSFITLCLLMFFAYGVHSRGRVLRTLLAGTLYACLPYDIHMSKTARSWEMVTLLCIIFTYLSYTYKSRGRFRGTVVCVLTGALALYTHFIALVYIGGVLIAVFWTERGSGDLRFLKGLTLGLFLLFLPWLAVVFPFQMMIKASLPQEHLRYLWADHGLTTLLSVMNPGGYNPLDHIRHAVGMRYECGVAISVLSVCIILGRIRTCLKYDFMRFILVQTAAMLLLLLISPVPLCNQRTMIIFMPGLIILLAVCLTDLMTSGAPAYRIGAALFATCFITLSLIGFPFRSERSTLTEACRFLSPHMEDSKTPVILVSPPHLLATLQYMKAHESVNLENTAVSPYRAVVLLDPYWKALNTTILPLPPPSCPSWRSGTHNEHGLVWTMNDFFRENQGVSEVFYIREGSGNLFGCRFPGEVRMWDYDRSAAFTMTAMHRFGKIAVYHLKRKPEHLPPRRTSI